jgi:geranylgeranyl diphosphate synthase type II
VKPFPLEAFLQRERELVECALERALADGMHSVPEESLAVVRDGVLGGGKRVRPILCVAAFQACAGEPVPEPVYDLAASLELIHAYSLMHDDLPCMDDAPLRRGRPTPHTIHGPARTARGGALLIPLAGLLAWSASGALDRSEGERREILGTLMDAAGARGMVGGQWVDLAAEGGRLREDALVDLHGRKTGALLAAALRIGGLASGASPQELEALERYGRSIGLAFQIADDVLDRTASTEELGKAPSDQALDKSTFVELLGVDGALERGRAEVAAALGALHDGGLESPALRALASYILERSN